MGVTRFGSIQSNGYIEPSRDTFQLRRGGGVELCQRAVVDTHGSETIEFEEHGLEKGSGEGECVHVSMEISDDDAL